MAFCGKSQQTWHWRWDQCCIFYKNGLTQVPNSKWLSLWLTPTSQFLKRKLFFTEFNERVNWIRPAIRLGDEPVNQSLPRNFYALF